MVGQFNGGEITTDGGGMLLREVEQRRGIIERFAACFRDHRAAGQVEHRVEELVAQRVYGLAKNERPKAAITGELGQARQQWAGTAQGRSAQGHQGAGWPAVDTLASRKRGWDSASRLNSIRIARKAASVAKNSCKQKSSAAKSDFSSSIRCSIQARRLQSRQIASGNSAWLVTKSRKV